MTLLLKISDDYRENKSRTERDETFDIYLYKVCFWIRNRYGLDFGTLIFELCDCIDFLKIYGAKGIFNEEEIRQFAQQQAIPYVSASVGQ